MYTIENSRLRAGFELHGAELVSLVDKKNNQELIWQADPTYWKRHAPVLFPFVGKVNGGEYRYDGKTYHMGQHGFARDMEFTLESATDTEIWFVVCPVMNLSSLEVAIRNNEEDNFPDDIILYSERIDINLEPIYEQERR